MSWSTLISGQVGSITTLTTVYTSDPLNPGESAHIQLKSDTNGTTDDLEVFIVTSVDGTDWDDDENAMLAFTIPKSPDPGYKSFLVSGVYRYRILAQRSGSTDTFTVDYKIRHDGISA